jgi:hypothetical protein
LLEWKRRRPELAAIEDGLWLMNAYIELKCAGFGVAMVCAGSDQFAINEPFQDVELFHAARTSEPTKHPD